MLYYPSPFSVKNVMSESTIKSGIGISNHNVVAVDKPKTISTPPVMKIRCLIQAHAIIYNGKIIWMNAGD
jgi:hypothetical protein